MATATSPAPDERSAKRPKPGDEGSASQPPHEDGGPPGYNGRPPPMYHYPPGGHPPHHPPPPGMPPGYMGGMPPYGGQYGGHWGGNPGAPGHMYPGGRPHPHMPPGGPPDRQGWNHYRNGPPPSHPPGSGRSGGKEEEGDEKYMKKSTPPPQGTPPPYGPPGGWGHGQSWQHQGPYGPPPPGYGGPPPMPHQSPGMYNQHPPYGGSKSPPRPRGDMYGRPPAPQSQGRTEMDISYLSTSGAMQRPMMDDDGANSSAGGSQKDKGRGSYKCGRCGVPKKGHVCPYQPKLKRRPDQPPPETRHAAVQVEMDEFMTLRRLNIRIQGFPESYATEPYMMAEDIVGGEPRQVTNDSMIVSVPPVPQGINGSVTAIPHESKLDEETMNDEPKTEERASPRSSPNGSRPPSSTSRDMGVGDDPVNGMEDVEEIVNV